MYLIFLNLKQLKSISSPMDRSNKKLFISWNCNGLFKHLEDLKILLSMYQPTIICLQETHLKENQTFHLLQYNILFKNQLSNYATVGMSLTINSIYNFTQIHKQIVFQAVAAKVFLPILTTVCSLYLPPDESITHDEIKNLLSSLPHPFVLCDDFNTHFLNWGCSKWNHKGKILENIVSSMNLALTNQLTTVSRTKLRDALKSI